MEDRDKSCSIEAKHNNTTSFESAITGYRRSYTEGLFDTDDVLLCHRRGCLEGPGGVAEGFPIGSGVGNILFS